MVLYMALDFKQSNLIVGYQKRRFITSLNFFGSGESIDREWVIAFVFLFPGYRLVPFPLWELTYQLRPIPPILCNRV